MEDVKITVGDVEITIQQKGVLVPKYEEKEIEQISTAERFKDTAGVSIFRKETDAKIVEKLLIGLTDLSLHILTEDHKLSSKKTLDTLMYNKVLLAGLEFRQNNPGYYILPRYSDLGREENTTRLLEKLLKKGEEKPSKVKVPSNNHHDKPHMLAMPDGMFEDWIYSFFEPYNQLSNNNGLSQDEIEFFQKMRPQFRKLVESDRNTPERIPSQA